MSRIRFLLKCPEQVPEDHRIRVQKYDVRPRRCSCDTAIDGINKAKISFVVVKRNIFTRKERKSPDGSHASIGRSVVGKHERKVLLSGWDAPRQRFNERSHLLARVIDRYDDQKRVATRSLYPDSSQFHSPRRVTGRLTMSIQPTIDQIIF